ncbi:MAG: 30S ribosomal protein S8 [Thermoguttaceae bacterium]
MMTDPVADMLTRIRNAVRVEHEYVDMPDSKLKRGVADVLKREGYIWDWERIEQKPQSVLRVILKYGPNGETLMQKIRRISKPGCRVYAGKGEFTPVLGGLGIRVVSTNLGVFSDREAIRKNVGGEVLCEIW